MKKKPQNKKAVNGAHVRRGNQKKKSKIFKVIVSGGLNED